LLYASFAIITKHLPSMELFGTDAKVVVGNLLLLAPGLIGISLGRNPNGAVNDISTRVRAIVAKRSADREPVGPSANSFAQTIDLETLGLDRPFTVDDLAVIDRALGLDEEAVAIPRAGAARSWANRGHALGALATNGNGNGHSPGSGHGGGANGSVVAATTGAGRS